MLRDKANGRRHSSRWLYGFTAGELRESICTSKADFSGILGKKIFLSHCFVDKNRKSNYNPASRRSFDLLNPDAIQKETLRQTKINFSPLFRSKSVSDNDLAEMQTFSPLEKILEKN